MIRTNLFLKNLYEVHKIAWKLLKDSNEVPNIMKTGNNILRKLHKNKISKNNDGGRLPKRRIKLMLYKNYLS